MDGTNLTEDCWKHHKAETNLYLLKTESLTKPDWKKIKYEDFSCENFKYDENSKKLKGDILYPMNTPNAFFRVGWDGKTVKE